MKHTLHPIFRSLAAVALVGAVGLASAQTVTPPPPAGTTAPKPAIASTPTSRLVSTFTPLAGSEQNASSLVRGLRTGSAVTMTDSTLPPPPGGTTPPPGGTTFTSPTKPMGYGNIRIALSLAEAKLASQGITNPTPTQLQGALMGTTTGTGPNATTTQGILQMRASGMGWGQIAHSQGFKLGPVMSGKQTFAAATTAGTTTSAAGSPVTTHGKSGVTTAAGHSAGKGGVTTAAGASAKGGVSTAGGGNAGSHGKSQVVTAGGSGGGGVANAFGHANNAGGASAGVVSAGGGHGGGNAGGASQGKGGGKP